nr:low molecular weight phosphatase family protein [Corynebacterium lactis]
MSEVLFVSRANMGVSRLLEGLLRQAAPELTVNSAGIDIDEDDRGLDEDARQALIEVGARCDGDPLQLTASLADRADVVVIVGDIDATDYVAPDCETERWTFDDPAVRGIHGKARYVDIREQMLGRIHDLARRLAAGE